MPKTIGVLALQGAFAEHVDMLGRTGIEAIEVRKPEALGGLAGLIIPGGESTSMGLIAQRWGLVEPLRRWVRSGLPTWGTCAGMILLAEHASGQKQGGQPLIGGLNVELDRNYFGRQIDSFELALETPKLGTRPYPAIFIRAPAIVKLGQGVESLARMTGKSGEEIHVAARQDNILATAFHPELTRDLRWHEYFVSMATE